MQEVRRAETLNATAEAFCSAATRLSEIDAVMVVLVQGDGSLLTIGTGGQELGGVSSGTVLDFPQPERLIERTKSGAWWLDLTDERLRDEELTARLANNGFTAIGNVPIRWEGELAGILALATKSSDGPEWVSLRLSAFEELGSYAGAVFGAEADIFSKRESLRSEVLRVIEEQRFMPVFQPFVELATGNVVGYEALTRFEDGVAPDQRFNQAHAVGLGTLLEARCAQAALDAATGLSPDVWLSLELLPAALLDGNATTVVNGAQRHVVLEITEYAQIKNYAPIRRAVQQLVDCQLAVDDAGAGYTSLNHILELRPDFVKLDISLVRDVDTNPARQAMVAGMCHFAVQSGTTLIAEGIETEAEAETLRHLGVPLGEGQMLAQGYLFGRPSSLSK